MGLFDRFKKRVKEVAEEVDSDALTAMEDSEEGVAALESSKHVEEDWEDDVPEIEEERFEEPVVESSDDDWDDWDDEDDTVNDMHVAQTGTFVVRLNSSVTTLNKGDLIQSNGDGTGKVQSDDIIRASTVAKVLSTTKIETYSDGSYIVPCSLHC